MKKVLTVDDSKVIRITIAQHLRPFDCRVIEAADGEEGLALARSERPDLILLDVSMPVMDGRQVLAALRADAATRAIPVIMLTGDSSQDLVTEIASLGVRGYLVKPFAPKRFEDTVARVLGPPTATSPPVAGGTVLVVDDSERLLEHARTVLEPGMKVLTASSGLAAIELYVKRHPAVVIIDMAMPEMDGVATLSGIKSHGGADGYFIALIVRGDEAARTQALAAGFAGVVEKPFQGSALADAAAARPIAAGAGPVTIVDDRPIVTIPLAGGDALAQFSPKEIVRRLAEDGYDRLILDLTPHRDVDGDVTKAVASLLESATGIGLRVAIVTPSQAVVASLKGLPETAKAIWADSISGARQELG